MKKKALITGVTGHEVHAGRHDEGPVGLLVIAGLVAGFGARLGNGCTSGHGVCGISRLSLRSVVATLLFTVSGVITVVVLRVLGVIS